MVIDEFSLTPKEFKKAEADADAAVYPFVNAALQAIQPQPAFVLLAALIRRRRDRPLSFFIIASE